MTRSALLGGLAVAWLAAALACAGFSRPALTPEERNAYEAALAELDSQPAAAEAALEDFVRRFPKSRLADDARLQLAELALARGDSDAALRELEQILSRDPSGSSSDLARLRLAQILIQRGQLAEAERRLADLRIPRLSRGEQRDAYRALADAAPDLMTRLRRLVALRGFESDEDAIALVDVEIDRVLLGLDASQLERAADRVGREIPAARIVLRRAELALDAGDLESTRRDLDRAATLPIAPAYRGRLAALREALKLAEAGLEETQPLPPYAEVLGLPTPRVAGSAGTLGVVLPLTGSFARFGEEALRGVLLAAGVFDGEGDRAIRVLVRDSAGDAGRAAAAVRELAGRRAVSAIVGPLLAAECEAAARAAEELGVPLLTLSSRAEIAAGRAYVARLRTRAHEEVEALVEHAVRVLGARTFAILYPQDDYGRALRNLFWDEVEESGGAVVAVARYDPDATDFADPIRRLVGYELLTSEELEALAEREKMQRRARRLPDAEARALRREAANLTAPDGAPLPPIVDFDVLFIPESHERVVLIAPQLAFHEASGARLLGPSGWDHPDLVPIAQRHVEGAVFASDFFEDSALPAVRAFTRGYRDTYDAAPNGFAAQGFDAATLVLVQLAEGRGSREAVRSGVLQTRAFPGASGVLSMRADGNARKRPFLLRVERGAVVEAEQGDAAEAID